uniref:Carboxylesterase n=1 Tax=uncultured marine group II/III euryarchaeote KM3_113_E08 TaxID=1457853 RepID=A0A075G7K0_9EURY|nr:carboxylesterase [uncultured marine group II/III euryarchaeote KM3_113_E08]
MGGLQTVIVEPEMEHTSTVVWLHGLGASGHDFEPVVPMLECPNTRFVFPHAPIMGVTINMGMEMPAWYDIKTLDWEAPDREDETSIRSSAKLIVELLEQEHERGIEYENIVLAGFSQGGALALHVGSRLQKKLAGMMILSAYQVLADTYDEEASDENRETPILFGHGVYDDMVPVMMGRAALESMVDAGNPCEWNGYRMGHEVIMDELIRIKEWLNDLLND